MTAIQDAVVSLAFGRILRLGSRPTQPGDAEEYEACRALMIDILEDDFHPTADYVPNYARDRNKGAQGDHP